MSSIHMNPTSTVALQTLRTISTGLDETQDQISTGYRVSTASDDVAYWSISTTMRSDNKAIGAVSDTIGLSKSIVDVTYTSLETVKDSLDTLKSLIVTMQAMPSNFDGSEMLTYPGVDGKRVIDNYDANWQSTYAGTQMYALDMEATTALTTARKAIDSASFNGVNLLLKQDDGGSLSTVNVATLVTGYNAGGVIRTMSLAASDFVLLNKGMSAADNSEDGLLDGLSRYQLGDGTWTQSGNSTLFTARQNGQVNEVRAEGFLLDIDLGMWHQGYLGLDRPQAFNAWLTNMDQQIAKIVDLMARVGSIQNAMQGYDEFNMRLSDNIDSGVSRLIDADMEDASARLSAFQTQQQLAVQSLQIANSHPQRILSLFQ